MKRLIFIILISLFISLSIFSTQNPDPIQSFVDAMKKTGLERINALKVYIKHFPETTSKWTLLAYFNIAVEYYQVKDYAEAVKQGEKRFTMANFGEGEEVRLALVLAESYGIKSSPVFNKEKAFKYINKAISVAKATGDVGVLKAAEKLKGQLSAGKSSTMSPEQKIKRLFSMEEFLEVISYYRALSAADKRNPEIHKIYANALLKANKYDPAIKEFKALYEKDKKATYAYRLGTIYSKKGQAISVDYFVEAGLLYGEEGNINNRDIAFGKAKAGLSEKYGYNRLVKEYNELRDRLKIQGKKNEAAIRAKKREIRAQKRKIRKYEEENGIDAPAYMYDKLNKLEEELKELEAGGVGFAKLAEYEKKIKELDETIQRELQEIRARAKKRLNL